MTKIEETKGEKERVWLPDFIRGFAILGVVTFHLVFNLSYFYGFKTLKYWEGFWFYEGRISALAFMTMVGVVTAIIYQEKGPQKALKINLKRGLRLLAIAMGITLVSWLAFPQEAVWFGILHLMGASILVTIPFSSFKWFNLLLGTWVIIFGSYIDSFHIQVPLMIPFGLTPEGFRSLDYYPLIPWMGVILIGIGLGNLLYKKIVQLSSPTAWQKAFIYLGKNSLWIYLIHLPLLYGVLWLIFR